MGFSVPHLLVVLAIVVLVFGTKRLKNVGADLGDAIKGFRNAVKTAEEEDKIVTHQEGHAMDVEVAHQHVDKV